MVSSGPFTVGVLGAGHVGAAITNALVLLGACRRVVLFDRKIHRAEAEAWDIEDGVPLLDEVEIVPTSSYADLASADVGGPPRRPPRSTHTVRRQSAFLNVLRFSFVPD